MASPDLCSRGLTLRILAVALIIVGGLTVALVAFNFLRPACVIQYDAEEDVATVRFRPPGEGEEETLPIYGARRLGIYHGAVERNVDETITFSETGNAYNLYGFIVFEARDGTPSMKQADLHVLGFGNMTYTCRRSWP